MPYSEWAQIEFARTGLTLPLRHASQGLPKTLRAPFASRRDQAPAMAPARATGPRGRTYSSRRRHDHVHHLVLREEANRLANPARHHVGRVR